jgi:SAM-dependent methyltransferase
MSDRIWQVPYYQFRLPKRRIVIDVTRSVPVYSSPVPGLADVAAELGRRGLKRIIDFGAGKLRNAKYLLQSRHSFKVFAVEFEECYQTPKAATMLSAIRKRYGDEFFLLKYPNPFLRHKATFDAALFINVASVMPNARERLRALREIATRLRSGGLFLWMTQYGEPHYRPGVTQRLKVGDGWAYNLHQHYQTFYKEWQIPEIQKVMLASGFSNPTQITASHHRAFLFERA